LTQNEQAIVCPPLTDELTVQVWFDATDDRLERTQSLISKWSVPNTWPGFAAFDAGKTDGLNATGYFGAVFDGRYVYFVSEMHGDTSTHANILRYDTHGDFRSQNSFEAFDASNVTGTETRGFYGASCDGRYVYFVPRQFDMDKYHSRVLRLDTRKPFKDPDSWACHDAGYENSQQSCAFDGRYMYFCPGFSGDPNTEAHDCGRVIRVDTQGAFDDPGISCAVDLSELLSPKAVNFDGGSFDGRYIYLVPLQNHAAVRYDTTQPFDAADAWQQIDARPLGLGMCVGAVFDGRFMYYVPYGHGVVVRFDTEADFEDSSAWSKYNASHTQGIRTEGFDGGFFDGRFVYFAPFYFGEARPYTFHSHFLRYDITGPFDDPRSWQGHNASATDGLHSVGYNAGAFDGRYFYMAPWQQGPASDGINRCITHGIVLRCDTLGDNGTFSLRYCDLGHNGGLNAGAPGPAFMVNTRHGTRYIAAYRKPPTGKCHMAGVYDGKTIRLYINGELVGQRDASGELVNNVVPVCAGRFESGSGGFHGNIERVQIDAKALTPDQMR